MISYDQLIDLTTRQAAFVGAVGVVWLPIEIWLYQIKVTKRLIRSA